MIREDLQMVDYVVKVQIMETKADEHTNIRMVLYRCKQTNGNNCEKLIVVNYENN